jgi:amino acid adenylation domain-containing protein
MIRLVQHLIEGSADRYPNKTALVSDKKRYTYGDIDKAADRLADGLSQCNLKPQDRVITFLDNSIESIVALFGILKAGGIFVPIHPGLKSKKLAYILHDTDAHAMIASAGKQQIVCEAIKTAPLLKHIIWVERSQERSPTADQSGPKHHSWNSFFEGNSAAHRPESVGIDVDLAALIYTSGSSGLPKGVMSAHYNMIAAVQSINDYIKNRNDDIILNVLPLSFDYGLYQILLAFHKGATVVLEKSFTYPYEIIELLSIHKITGFPIVPTIAAILGKMETIKEYELPNLRYITSTGDTLSAESIRKLVRLFPRAKIFSMYGLTECKRVSYLPPEYISAKPDSVGIPIPNSQVRIVSERGEPLPAGEVGELTVRGSHVMQGYWRLPEETERTFRPGRTRSDAVLHTGDHFKQDHEGFLYFVGRRTELIKCKGERVSPKEIENFLNGLEGVIQSAVIGIPDEIVGQRIAAIVVLREGNNLDSEMILRSCQDHLESQLVPQIVEIRERLPLSDNGKIDKKLLLQEYLRA